MEKAREAYEKLKAEGVRVPSWPDVDSIKSVRSFGAWCYTRLNYFKIQSKEIYSNIYLVFRWCDARLGKLKEERSERISKMEKRYAGKRNPFQRRERNGESPE